MNKIKVVFSQSLMISTGIIFVIGIQALIRYCQGTYDAFTWPWYMPLSIILVGIIGALPTLIIYYIEDKLRGFAAGVGIFIHYLCTGAIVLGCGALFKWYATWEEFWPIMIMYTVVYGFVWIATIWISKNDEKKINEAIKVIRDEE